MSTAQLLTIYLGAALLTAAAAGLLARGRVAYCWSFVPYLLATATFTLLIAHWPERFYTFAFWSTKETVLIVLNILVALEIWLKSFSRFPRARVRIGLVLAGALVATAIAAQTIPTDLLPYDALIGVLQPRLLAGTLSLLAIIVCGAWWYRVPLHPLHRAIFTGLSASLTAEIFLLSVVGWQSGSPQVLQWTSALNSAIYTGAEAWWAWAAWRPHQAPNPILARLQPWAHSW